MIGTVGIGVAVELVLVLVSWNLRIGALLPREPRVGKKRNVVLSRT